ncbi:hypothetical protein ARMSODRAFT_623085 [Armillaria solidipes]|uniref:Uncharacterized protein n=1 Tax=Armillaria solidipes TaxID=1076256 RepID=A0A2H3BF41_9AGAR|nr:hypothetical protein ARMSODRAFT_623085 [Armillaria solidipes]
MVGSSRSPSSFVMFHVFGAGSTTDFQPATPPMTLTRRTTLRGPQVSRGRLFLEGGQCLWLGLYGREEHGAGTGEYKMPSLTGIENMPAFFPGNDRMTWSELSPNEVTSVSQEGSLIALFRVSIDVPCNRR